MTASTVGAQFETGRVPFRDVTHSGGGATPRTLRSIELVASVTRSGRDVPLPRSLTVIRDGSTVLVDDAGANAYGAASNYKDAVLDLTESLRWLEGDIERDADPTEAWHLQRVKAMLFVLEPDPA